MTIEDRIAALSPARQALLARQPAAARERALSILEGHAWAERQPIPRSRATQPAPGQRADVRGLGPGRSDPGSYWPE